MDELNLENAEGALAQLKKTLITEVETVKGQLEQYIINIVATLRDEMANIKTDLESKISALEAENKKLKEDLEAATDKLNKMMLIGFIACGVVAVILLGCVISLFGKTKAIAQNSKDDEDEEDNK